jgi:hypothetical protein
MVTESGRTTTDSEEHNSKRLYSMKLVGDGIVMNDIDEHPLKQNFPITVTEFGSTIDNSDEHL